MEAGEDAACAGNWILARRRKSAGLSASKRPRTSGVTAYTLIAAALGIAAIAFALAALGRGQSASSRVRRILAAIGYALVAQQCFLKASTGRIHLGLLVSGVVILFLAAMIALYGVGKVRRTRIP